MRKIFLFCLLAVLVCTSISGVSAAQVDCDATYCFTATDFSYESDLEGICVTGLPQASAGTVMLGRRVIRPGDILTCDQVAQMTFCPLRTQEDIQAQVTYLPIFTNRVEPATTMTISIHGKEDKSPIAKDSSLETYKNLPNEGTLSVSDPEGETLTFSLVRQPKRGQVELREDGSFTYTPKKNKVGVDSFTFTAADPSGNVSREATVTIQILKPTDSRQYKDTVGRDCRFAAEWMRNTGLFVGEQVGGETCFYPEKTVSRGEFLTMLVDALDIPTDDTIYTAIPEDTPGWLKPYLAAAMRSGITAGLPQEENGSFCADRAVTGAEAAVMLQNALDLSITQSDLEAAAVGTDEQIPVWAQVSLATMSHNGIVLDAQQPLTRGQLAQVMYQVSSLALDAPGMSVIRMQN